MLSRRFLRNFTEKSNILVVGGGQIGKAVSLGLRGRGFENVTVADPRLANRKLLGLITIKQNYSSYSTPNQKETQIEFLRKFSDSLKISNDKYKLEGFII